jgi:hypothetical protein
MQDVDPKALALLIPAIIGAIKLFRSVWNGFILEDPIEQKKSWNDAGVIIVSALTGWAFSSSVGLTGFNGMLAGLNASGIITAVSYAGKTLTEPTIENGTPVKEMFKTKTVI